jgi:hypothetical protein
LEADKTTKFLGPGYILYSYIWDTIKITRKFWVPCILEIGGVISMSGLEKPQIFQLP